MGIDRWKRKHFGQWLKSVRDEKGLTMTKVSDAMGYASIGTINNLERGAGTLPVEKVHSLAIVYGIPVEDLLEKIRDCEPELYRKYQDLQEQIIGHFTAKVVGIAGSRPAVFRSLHNQTLSDTSEPGNTEYILSDVQADLFPDRSQGNLFNLDEYRARKAA